MKMMKWVTALMVGGLVAGCAGNTTIDSNGLDVGPEEPGAGKSFFLPTDENAGGKSDRIQGAPGLRISVDSSSTAVWEIRNQWTDTETTEARLAGMAWAANSGLSWNQKYAAWVQSMEKIDSQEYFQTYQLTTPYGKTLPAPALECAELSIFLRVTFASWYGLPYFMEAKDREGRRLYLGHFGFRTAEAKYPNSPRFKNSYRDYRDQAQTWQSTGWPQDSRLRTRKLGGSQDDWQEFLFEGARAGAYFDEVFLNKRVGYFMVYALSYFGSMNLADSRNSYNITPRAVREGDTLLERYQRRGIGHTLVVKNVDRVSDDNYQIDLISGSMPRRQGKWDDAASSRAYFTEEAAGGSERNHNGVQYAALGGGLKRWRLAQVVSGRWANVVDPADGEVFISNSDHEAIGARVAEFENLIEEASVEERLAVLLARIEDKRNHLRLYPASCSARINRENAFNDLYFFESEQNGSSAADVDAKYRQFEDYVFAELVYEESKTCCWNSTTSAMYDIIMAYNVVNYTEGIAAQECRAPVVFMNHRDGYSVFKNFAIEMGRGNEWVEWNDDESCPQKNVAVDALHEVQPTPFCENVTRQSEADEESNTAAGNESDNTGESVCENTCEYANDGECDDGGPNSLFEVCDYGSDCGDCGTRN